MSERLIPVTAAQIKQLPDGVLLLRACHSPIRSGRLDRAHILATVGHDGARALGEDEGAVLDLSDETTAIVVAARASVWFREARPWPGDYDSARRLHAAEAAVYSLLHCWRPPSSLSRAEMEGLAWAAAEALRWRVGTQPALTR